MGRILVQDTDNFIVPLLDLLRPACNLGADLSDSKRDRFLPVRKRCKFFINPLFFLSIAGKFLLFFCKVAIRLCHALLKMFAVLFNALNLPAKQADIPLLALAGKIKPVSFLLRRLQRASLLLQFPLKLLVLAPGILVIFFCFLKIP